MADDPKLIVAVEARLDRFERQLRQAGLIAEREAKNIESKLISGTAIGNIVARGIERAMDAAVDEIKRVIDEMNKLNDVLERTGITAEQFQRIGFAGVAGGLSTKDLLAGLDGVGAKLDEINRRENDLSRLLDANKIKYKERNGLVVDANKGLELAAQLMAKAGSEFAKGEIARTFGLTTEWVKVLGDGVEKFREIKNAATVDENLARALQHMKALSGLADRLTAEFKSWGTSLVTSVLPALETTATAILTIAQALQDVFAHHPGRGQDFSDELVNRWGKVVEQIRAARAEAEGPLKITVNKPSGVKFPAAAGTGEKDALTKQVEALRKINALTEAELQTIGLTVAKQEEKRQITLLEEAAKRAGLNAETAVTEEMRKQAVLAGELRQRLVERQHAWQEMMSASRELGSIMSDAMKAMVLEGQKFDQVLKNIGNRIASKAFDKLFDVMFAAPAGGGGSLFTSLFGGGRMAGGPVRSGSAYMVGERGPELFVPNKSGQVIPNTALSNGGGGVTIGGQTTNVVVQGSADRQTLGLMQQMLAARDRRFVADVAHATAELRRRSAFA